VALTADPDTLALLLAYELESLHLARLALALLLAVPEALEESHPSPVLIGADSHVRAAAPGTVPTLDAVCTPARAMLSPIAFTALHPATALTSTVAQPLLAAISAAAARLPEAVASVAACARSAAAAVPAAPVAGAEAASAAALAAAAAACAAAAALFDCLRATAAAAHPVPPLFPLLAFEPPSAPLAATLGSGAPLSVPAASCPALHVTGALRGLGAHPRARILSMVLTVTVTPLSAASAAAAAASGLADASLISLLPPAPLPSAAVVGQPGHVLSSSSGVPATTAPALSALSVAAIATASPSTASAAPRLPSAVVRVKCRLERPCSSTAGVGGDAAAISVAGPVDGAPPPLGAADGSEHGSDSPAHPGPPSPLFYASCALPVVPGARRRASAGAPAVSALLVTVEPSALTAGADGEGTVEWPLAGGLRLTWRVT
jgi:hypothetical protein